jgi:hypothetical protein
MRGVVPSQGLTVTAVYHQTNVPFIQNVQHPVGRATMRSECLETRNQPGPAFADGDAKDKNGRRPLTLLAGLLIAHEKGSLEGVATSARWIRNKVRETWT